MKKNLSTMPVLKSSKLLSLILMFMLSNSLSAKDHHQPGNTKAISPLEGRWDLTIDMDGKSAPSWLEVNHSGLSMLTGHFVGTGGSARPISRVYFANGKFNFSIPPQWEKEENNLDVEGILSGDNMNGTMKFPDGKTYNWNGKRAPSLNRVSEPKWGKPVVLFDGKNLDQWHTAGDNQWKAEEGMLRSPQTGSNLITNKKFNDFKLHIEFRIPAESNSGVYLRGRYEVQIEDSKGMEPLKDYFSAIYGFIEPTEMMAKAAGEWQTYDITLIGRNVTIIANGKMVICDRPVPGITGGALDSNEGEPGPILLQGDHGPVDFRNIIITPAK